MSASMKLHVIGYFDETQVNCAFDISVWPNNALAIS